VYLKLLGAFFRPTLELDRPATESRRERAAPPWIPTGSWWRAARRSSAPTRWWGARSTTRCARRRDELLGRRGTERQYSRVAGAVLYNLLVIALFGVTLLLFRPQLYASMRALLVIAGSFVRCSSPRTLISQAGRCGPS
jgi:hypothetical protein